MSASRFERISIKTEKVKLLLDKENEERGKKGSEKEIATTIKELNKENR